MDTMQSVWGIIPDQGVICPVCEFEYIHPVSVEVNAGGSITTVDQLGTRMTAGKPAGRGVLISLGFTCENGHNFTIALQFHKGATSAALVDVGEGEWQPTIWRD